MLGIKIGFEQCGQLGDDLGGPNACHFRLTRSGEGEKLIDPGCHTVAFLDDGLSVLSLLRVIGQRLGQSLCPTANQTERIACFVGQTGGCLAELAEVAGFDL